MIGFHPDFDNLSDVVIVDIADAKRVLVDGKGFPRVLYPIKRLTLTKLCMPMNRGARTGTVTTAVSDFDLDAKWAETPTCKKLAVREARANLTDFDRFKVMIHRKRRAFDARHLVKKAISKPKAGKAKKGKVEEKKVVAKGKKGKKQ